MKRKQQNSGSQRPSRKRTKDRPELSSEIHEDTQKVSASSLATFCSCLTSLEDPVQVEPSPCQSPRSSNASILRRALSIRELDDDSWLTSSLIDLVVSVFAKQYADTTHYMSIDFAIISLTSASTLDLFNATDISGRRLNYSDTSKSIVFICNSQNIHWNLIRIIRHPKPELQLFEPMGKPVNRRGGLNFRSVPRVVIEWLDHCCPIKGKSWLSVGASAITKQQQYTTFDCGVACLLYAEKCGQGQVKEEINDCTTQENITDYRQTLQNFLKQTALA